MNYPYLIKWEPMPWERDRPTQRDADLYQCGASVRLRKVCHRLGISTVKQLSKISFRRFARQAFVGKTTLKEATKILERHGFEFTPYDDDQDHPTT